MMIHQVRRRSMAMAISCSSVQVSESCKTLHAARAAAAPDGSDMAHFRRLLLACGSYCLPTRICIPTLTELQGKLLHNRHILLPIATDVNIAWHDEYSRLMLLHACSDVYAVATIECELGAQGLRKTASPSTSATALPFHSKQIMMIPGAALKLQAALIMMMSTSSNICAAHVSRIRLGQNEAAEHAMGRGPRAYAAPSKCMVSSSPRTSPLSLATRESA